LRQRYHDGGQLSTAATSEVTARICSTSVVPERGIPTMKIGLLPSRGPRGIRLDSLRTTTCDQPINAWLWGALSNGWFLNRVGVPCLQVLKGHARTAGADRNAGQRQGAAERDRGSSNSAARATAARWTHIVRRLDSLAGIAAGQRPCIAGINGSTANTQTWLA